MRVATVLVGAAATAMAIFVTTVYGLWYLCADLVYVILFPQLLSVVWLPITNTYGSIVGYLLGLFFRFSGGEALFHMPPLIYYPWYDYELGQQMFPFKTLAMLISLTGIIVTSLFAHFLFVTLHINSRFDVCRSFTQTAYLTDDTNTNLAQPNKDSSVSLANKDVAKNVTLLSNGYANTSFSNGENLLPIMGTKH